jgi:hypothetical protein
MSTTPRDAADFLVSTRFAASVGTDDEPAYISGGGDLSRDLEGASVFPTPGEAMEAARRAGHAVCSVLRMTLRASVYSVGLTSASREVSR